MDFETLKQSSSNFDKLTKAIEANLNPEDKEKNKSKYQDDRFWKPELDKTGNGFAVIRFLPAPEGEDLPWQRVWSHAFQDVGGWYIENSLTTLGQKDPVSEENTRLWNTGFSSSNAGCIASVILSNIFLPNLNKNTLPSFSGCLGSDTTRIFEK